MKRFLMLVTLAGFVASTTPAFRAYAADPPKQEQKTEKKKTAKKKKTDEKKDEKEKKPGL